MQTQIQVIRGFTMTNMTFFPATVEDDPLPSNDLVPVEDIELLESAKKYAAASRKESTRKSYASDLRHFESWCNERRWPALPASVNVVMNYAIWMADEGLAASTIRKRMVVVGLAHQRKSHWNPCDDPEVKEVLTGIKNSLGGPNKKQALLKEDLRQMIEILDRNTVKGRRDFALVVLGYTGAFRRNEIVSINLSDIKRQDGGLSITVPLERSKAGRAQIKPIAATHSENCPVQAVLAVQADLKELGDTTGFLFPSPRKKKQSLNCRYYVRLLKKLGVNIGLDDRNISGHSLRRGRMTQMSLDNYSLPEMQRISSHRSVQMVVDYIEQTGSVTNAPKSGL